MTSIRSATRDTKSLTVNCRNSNTVSLFPSTSMKAIHSGGADNWDKEKAYTLLISILQRKKRPALERHSQQQGLRACSPRNSYITSRHRTFRPMFARERRAILDYLGWTVAPDLVAQLKMLLACWLLHRRADFGQ